MTRKLISVFVGLTVLAISSVAFGWSPVSTHPNMTQRILDYNFNYSDMGISDVFSHYISQYGLSVSAIKQGSTDLDLAEYKDTYHNPGWSTVSGRQWLTVSKWEGLNENRRIGFLLHLAEDSGVPVNHSPAGTIYTESGVKVVEGIVESRAETWAYSSYPSPSPYSGTYSQQMSAALEDVYDNARALKANHDYFPPFVDEVKSKISEGLRNGTDIGAGMLLQYFLNKEATIANANGNYSVNPGGSITFSSAGSMDPDSVTVSGSTVTNNGGGLSSIKWDLNNDGTYETSGASPTLSHSTLVNLVGYTEGKTIRLQVKDDEGDVYLNNHQGTAYDTATIAVYSNPTADAHGAYSVYEGGSVQFSGTGSDADGGSVSFAWDKDNNGSYETGGQNPTFGYSTWSPSETGHTVKLRVTDNENQTVTDTAVVRVYSNPTADAHGAYSVYEGGSVQLYGTGGDADGGSVSYAWDKDSNGSYETGGQNPTFGYSTWTPSEAGHTVVLRVTDNEGQTKTDTSTVRVYSNPTAAGKAQYGWMGKTGDVPSEWDWNNLIDNGSFDADGGSIVTWEWDLNNDGTFEKSGDGPTRVYYSDFTAVGVTPNENHMVTLRVTDNEGQTKIISGISSPILANPTCNAGASAAAYQGGSSAHFSGSGSDPDGGSITQYRWDIDNDGTWDIYTSSATLSYEDLVGAGYNLAPSEIGRTVRFGVVDDDADITSWWSGEAEDTTELYLYSLPTVEAMERYILGPGESIAFDAAGGDADGGGISQWLWDLDGDGQYDDFTGRGNLTYDQLCAMNLDLGEWLTIGLKVVDNEGQVAFDTALLALYPSIMGDANGDGVVGLADLTAMGGAWGTYGGWENGDFNLDGIVGLADLTVLGSTWGDSVSSGPMGTTPEPATLSLLGLAVPMFLRRRKK